MPIEVTAENYKEIRAEISEKNANFLGVVLRDKEKILDEKLKRYIKECSEMCGGNIPCDKPVLLKPELWRTELYRFCKALPKGGDLHVHGTSLMPIWRLIKFLSERDDIVIDPKTLILHLPKENIKGCIPVGEALDEGIIDRITLEKQWTVAGCGANIDIWRYFEDLFGYQAAIDMDMNILFDYYVAAFEDCIKNGIYHTELHILLSEDLSETLDIVKTVKKAYFAVKKKYEYFSVRIIGSSMKMFDYSVEITKKIFSNTITAQEQIKDDFFEDNIENFVVGFDLINEEDTSRSLNEYAEMLIELKKKHPDFGYFLHCGESLNSKNDNLIDAYLLGSKRVGHGMNLYRYPDLLRRYAKDEICLEVCPISNQTLRYTRDLRLHPGAEYLKRGVSISLCSDDPVYQEHEMLTDDFFAATVAWGLGIAEIKQLCINSIMFSELNARSKKELMKFWNKKWNEFVDKMI